MTDYSCHRRPIAGKIHSSSRPPRGLQAPSVKADAPCPTADITNSCNLGSNLTSRAHASLSVPPTSLPVGTPSSYIHHHVLSPYALACSRPPPQGSPSPPPVSVPHPLHRGPVHLYRGVDAHRHCQCNDYPGDDLLHFHLYR